MSFRYFVMHQPRYRLISLPNPNDGIHHSARCKGLLLIGVFTNSYTLEVVTLRFGHVYPCELILYSLWCSVTSVPTWIMSPLENPASDPNAVYSPRAIHRALANAWSVTNREPCAAEGTPPASPGAARRARDDDVFLRLAGATAADSAPPRGVVKELPLKVRSHGKYV